MLVTAQRSVLYHPLYRERQRNRRSDAIAADVTDYLQEGSGAGQYKLLANRIRNAVQSRREAQRADRQEELMRLTEFVGNTGGFEMDTETGKFLLTDGARRILDVPETPKCSFEDGLQDLHPDDRENIQQTVLRAIKTGERTQGTQSGAGLLLAT